MRVLAGSSAISAALTYAGTAVVGIACGDYGGERRRAEREGRLAADAVTWASGAAGKRWERNAVGDATVNVYQTVYAWEGACAAAGPCASAPVLKTQRATMTADASGLVTITPLVVVGVPQVVEMAAASGATGFVTLSLVVTP